jgi:predicted transcriptional regulator
VRCHINLIKITDYIHTLLSENGRESAWQHTIITTLTESSFILLAVLNNKHNSDLVNRQRLSQWGGGGGRVFIYTGWRRETAKYEIIRKKRRILTKLNLILKMCSTRVEISLGITF